MTRPTPSAAPQAGGAPPVPDELRGYARGRRYRVLSYGCHMNEHDGEAYAGLLEAAGFARAAPGEAAELLLVNTCCVCRTVELRMEEDLRSVAARDAELVVVCGCLTQRQGEARRIAREFPFVRVVFGTGGMGKLYGRLCEALARRGAIHAWEEPAPAPEGLPMRRESGVSALVGIMSGCDRRCAYCVVPLVRGRAVCRDAEAVLAEVRGLKARGCREVTLLGQNVAAYEGGGASFTRLLELVSETGMDRVRFYTAHPRDVSRGLLELMARTPSIEKHLHLPVESGSDRVLRAMGRGYSRRDYMATVEAFYGLMPDGCVSTDAIVGFPGETEGDFQETVSLFGQVGFAHAYLFAYSPREGTAAAAAPGQVGAQVKRERFSRLASVQGEAAARRLRRFTGKVERVLVGEQPCGEHRLLCGRTSSAVETLFHGGPELIGGFVDVLVTSSDERGLRGEALPPAGGGGAEAAASPGGLRSSGRGRTCDQTCD
ncbi:MAG: tRNA (N6-isopentenyl adenosine(37)-C2)-methylthiotransferase MiaB [Acidobacteriota bacterium]|jgi:tRNA-2-methylthio-N6-dimethylallyladenosine synthase|nr:tRNA (N6-isopentenyl adenosine(37)-C2)-methylthiotransferase MiaB [Acidobacteriota bacterium]